MAKTSVVTFEIKTADVVGQLATQLDTAIQAAEGDLAKLRRAREALGAAEAPEAAPEAASRPRREKPKRKTTKRAGPGKPGVGPTQDAVLRLVREGVSGPAAIRERTGKSVSSIQCALSALSRAGLIRNAGYGSWVPVGPEDAESEAAPEDE